MLMCGSITYDTDVKTLAPEDYARLRTVFRKWPEDQQKWSRWEYGSDLLLDDREAQILTDLGLRIEISRAKGLHYDRDFQRKVIDTLDDAYRAVTYQVSVSNVGLFAIDEVTYREDCCTDELQDDLDKGWRNLAVCPPNDARRPTYILGRARPKEGA